MTLKNRINALLRKNEIELGSKDIPEFINTQSDTLEDIINNYGYEELSKTYREQLFLRFNKEEIDKFNDALKINKPFRLYHDYQRTGLSGFKDYTIHPKNIKTYPCMTLGGNEGCILLDDKLTKDSKLVKLSINAREALQGYPKDYTQYGMDEDGKTVVIAKTNRIKMCGNGVSSIIPKTILTTLIPQQDIKVLSLCSGLGGMELLLPDNFQVIGFSELGKAQSQVLKYHHPDVPNHGDLTKINPDELEDFDLLLAGFPCQAYSQNGLRKGLDDPRGKIIYNIFDIIQKKKPKYILAENVKGLLTHNKSETFISIIKGLNDCGYTVNFKLLNSSNFGLAQERERVYIFCERK